ncbi:hypothetical protein V5F89_12305 [Pelagerythrobacter marensis]|uniref:Uncharacterized protein n=1 Tax=Pelagerythrobacter marensis TaxID=543877 RepID=A0ABZ2D5C6_9SPHN
MNLVADARAFAERYRDAKRLSGTAMANLPHRKTVAAMSQPQTANDRRPPRENREPCPFCATRGDLGCCHFAPFKAAPE